MKRLRSLIISLLLLFVSLPILAAETEEVKKPWWTEVLMQSDGTSKAILWYERDVTESFGFFALATAEDPSRYAAVYAGPYWKPTDWSQIGVGIGRENQPNAVRRALFYSIDTEKFYSFGTFENGGSGPWHRAHAIYRLNEKWSAGAMTERDVGFGPRIEFNPTKDSIIWISVLRGNVPNAELELKERKTTVMVGFSISF